MAKDINMNALNSYLQEINQPSGQFNLKQFQVEKPIALKFNRKDLDFLMTEFEMDRASAEGLLKTKPFEAILEQLLA